jgi:hypothetical protein
MSLLAFLSAGTAAGVVELRGDVGAFEEELIVHLTPRRAVALTDDAPALVARARASGLRAYDLSAGHAELRIESDVLLRRLTEVDVHEPTAAPVARGVPALIFPRDDGYDLYVPQELARYVCDVVRDLQESLA